MLENMKIGKVEDFENHDWKIGKDCQNRENPAGSGKMGGSVNVKDKGDLCCNLSISVSFRCCI
jgi:hypothetical protein